ncbi:MAG TPA: hypothetical protein VHQ22_21090 [Terriglobales bacterium]|jgi:phosphoribosylformimino-5-aminoimidazole carboxamide ribonucleotide (ProFAR) isomerase|nr:hypothetical protein [Terriglobales bacterium]
MTDDERIAKLQDANLTIARQLITLDSAIADLRASVNALRVVVAAQNNGDQPEQALKQIQELEQKFLEHGGGVQENQKAAQIAEALQAWMRAGRRPLDS